LFYRETDGNNNPPNNTYFWHLNNRAGGLFLYIQFYWVGGVGEGSIRINNSAIDKEEYTWDPDIKNSLSE